MQHVNWGIIGCGDVTEIKSGPAFNKVRHSSLVAVMRRDASKAKDYARRHNVPAWYDAADQLISDNRVNAVYIATPPVYHEQYTLAALRAGKPVYVEKPMATTYASAINMLRVAAELNVKLVVAHYRREQAFFIEIRRLLQAKVIGDIRFATCRLYKRSLSVKDLDDKTLWRVDPAVSGGGLFHDLAPHQLDLACYFFGEFEKAGGYSLRQADLYKADDIVSGNITFKNGILFNGLWCFNVAQQDEKDLVEITGSRGTISFSVFGNHTATITRDNKTELISFDIPQHVQQPMINKVVEYFLGRESNPCSAAEGAQVMQLMDLFTVR